MMMMKIDNRLAHFSAFLFQVTVNWIYFRLMFIKDQTINLLMLNQ